MGGMNSISLDAAEVMTGISRRTLWRRVADGRLTSADKDSRGRTTVVLDGDLLALVQTGLGLTLDAPAQSALVQADTGHAQAQAELGAQLFDSAGKLLPAAHTAALYWLQQAAQQGQADAMHWLGLDAAQQGSAPSNHHQALAWLAQAAAHGHVIAQQQVQTLLEGGLR